MYDNSQFQLKRVNLDKQYLLEMETNELCQVFCNCWECETAPSGVARKTLIKMILNSGNFKRPEPNIPAPAPEPEPEPAPLIQEIKPQLIKLTDEVTLFFTNLDFNEKYDEELLEGDVIEIKKKNLNQKDWKIFKNKHAMTGQAQRWMIHKHQRDEELGDYYIIVDRDNEDPKLRSSVFTTESTPNPDLISLSPQ